ncbi:MAG: DUF2505 domain-containing protein [Nocardioidaceae bacterium]|jgi:hypothetical protein|nr:DUF2505 domain-containing protein [Nocardioidaceae bacterium]
MDLRAEINYPTHDPADAFALVVDPVFRAEVCEAVHALDYDVSVDERGDGTALVTIDRVMPADVPDVIKKMVGETVTIVQTEDWGAPNESGERTAELLIKIVGQPVTMKGTIELRNAAGFVVSSIHGDVKVAVPFFGKKVEPEIAKAILAAVASEQEAATARLGSGSV